MSLAFPGTATTGKTTSAATHVVNLPSSIVSGELLVVGYLVADAGRYLTVPSGWDGEYHADNATSGTIGYVYKDASGSEGSTETFTVNTGTTQVACVSFRVTGFATADPFNTDNNASDYHAIDTSAWPVSANVLTGVNNSDSNIILIGGAKAVRTISTQDSGQTLIASVNDGYSVHVLREETPGSGNSAYSNDMSDSRAWIAILLEIKAAAAGGGGRIMGSLIGPGGMIGSNGGLIR